MSQASKRSFAQMNLWFVATARNANLWQIFGNPIERPLAPFPFIITFHPHSHAVKSIIFKNFKLLKNYIMLYYNIMFLFKRDKNIGDFQDRRSVLKSDDQPKCAYTRCKTCSFVYNAANSDLLLATPLMLSIAQYIGETGRRLGDRFHQQECMYVMYEHLRDAERNDKDASKSVARDFNLPNHSHKCMPAACGISVHHGNTECRKKNKHFPI